MYIFSVHMSECRHLKHSYCFIYLLIIGFTLPHFFSFFPALCCVVDCWCPCIGLRWGCGGMPSLQMVLLQSVIGTAQLSYNIMYFKTPHHKYLTLSSITHKVQTFHICTDRGVGSRLLLLDSSGMHLPKNRC